jgi:hypothetical protein
MLSAMVCVGCGGVPRPTPEVMPEVAATYGALFNEGDEARLLALFTAERRAGGLSWKSHVWLREQLGACGEPEFMWSFSNRGARFSYPCERGALEAAFVLDEAGKIVDMDMGAVGVPVAESLSSAAAAVLASLPEGAATPRPFKHNLDWGVAEKLGKCQVVRPWVVRELGAVFHLECVHGDAALLALRVHEDGTIAYVGLTRSAGAYRGPAVWLPEPRVAALANDERPVE